MLNEFTALLISVSINLQQSSVDLLECHKRILTTVQNIKAAQTNQLMFDKIYDDTFSNTYIDI